MMSEADTNIELTFDLFELPTAQHKAGLAGFVLAMESMRKRNLSPLPDVTVEPSSVTVGFTQESLQTVFDDIYDASPTKVESRSKWKGKEPLETIERKVKDKSGKEKKQKYFVYESIQPKGAFLESYYPDGDGLWLKLWRDMTWRILRGIPATRRVYEERAEGNPSSVAVDVWDELIKSRKDAAKGRIRTESISSSLFLGAQDVNAEKVNFKGRVEHNLLLHFWTIVSLLFDARTLTLDGDIDDAGFVIVIPEPGNLEYFVEDVTQLFNELDIAKSGYRPRQSLIYVPEEGGLVYLFHIAQHRTQRSEISDSVVAVEVMQMQKQGNNIRALASERIEPSKETLGQYEVIRKGCWNPLFRAKRIRNLLDDRPWYTGMDDVFATYPWEFFVHSIAQSPKKIPFFGMDAWKRFRGIESDLAESNA